MKEGDESFCGEGKNARRRKGKLELCGCPAWLNVTSGPGIDLGGLIGYFVCTALK